MLFDTKDIEAERDRLLSETRVVSDAVQQNIRKNAHAALDQTEYWKRYDNLSERYDSLKTRIDELTDKIHETSAKKADIGDFLAAFEKSPDHLTEFSLDIFNALTDFITVYSEKDICATFRNEQTIKV